jgi:hypothetical protein
MNEKVLKFEKIFFGLRKQVKMNENFEFSHFKNMEGMTNLANSKPNPLSSQKIKYAFTPRLLSHSPNDKWCK